MQRNLLVFVLCLSLAAFVVAPRSFADELAPPTGAIGRKTETPAPATLDTLSKQLEETNKQIAGLAKEVSNGNQAAQTKLDELISFQKKLEARAGVKGKNVGKGKRATAKSHKTTKKAHPQAAVSGGFLASIKNQISSLVYRIKWLISDRDWHEQRITALEKTMGITPPTRPDPTAAKKATKTETEQPAFGGDEKQPTTKPAPEPGKAAPPATGNGKPAPSTGTPGGAFSNYSSPGQGQTDAFTNNSDQPVVMLIGQAVSKGKAKPAPKAEEPKGPQHLLNVVVMREGTKKPLVGVPFKLIDIQTSVNPMMADFVTGDDGKYDVKYNPAKVSVDKETTFRVALDMDSPKWPKGLVPMEESYADITIDETATFSLGTPHEASMAAIRAVDTHTKKIGNALFDGNGKSKIDAVGKTADDTATEVKKLTDEKTGLAAQLKTAMGEQIAKLDYANAIWAIGIFAFIAAVASVVSAAKSGKRVT